METHQEVVGVDQTKSVIPSVETVINSKLYSVIHLYFIICFTFDDRAVGQVINKVCSASWRFQSYAQLRY